MKEASLLTEGARLTYREAERILWAVVQRAIQDARNAEAFPDAPAWLLHCAPGWLDMLGLSIDAPTWKAWVLAGCPTDTLTEALGQPQGKFPNEERPDREVRARRSI